ncbi:response regulator [Negadavirga shengliensis]|uniref:Response regulator n=1 Tax=Negadavirga shengliensis TaxID=1389218 RepID=A0ABV9T7B7_9BACT
MVNIVLVDDDDVSNFVTEKFIYKSFKGPCRVFKFSSATEALKEVGKIKPNYLFVDLVMPQMTGWDFLERLGEANINSEVYILSGSVDEMDYDKVANYKTVRKFLTKFSVRESLPEIFRN